MSGFTLFTNSSDGVSFEPDYGFANRDKKIQNQVRTRNGNLFQYKFSDYRAWRIPLRFVSSGDKEAINGWWRENTDLFFYDYNDTTANGTRCVRITNKSAPISTTEKPYDYEWKGKIDLEEF